MSSFIIDDEVKLKQKTDLIESLRDIEIATKIIEESSNTNDVIDQHYNKLKCKINHIQENSNLHKMLSEYLTNTASDEYSRCNLSIIDAYEITREGESERFTDFGNKMLLWHGSRMTNFVGILSQGKKFK